MKSSRWQNVLNHFSGLLLFAFIFVNALSAFAGPGKTTYQAKIVKPDGYPLEATSVNFKFTILDPAGSCILYSETYSSVNMTSTGGLISFALGSGVKTYPASATTFEQVFSNITPSLSCDTGGPASYSPTATDIRKIVMQFHDGSGWQTLPAMSINAVPYAMYANEAAKLNGLQASDFVQLSTVPTCTVSEALRYTGASFSCVAVGSSVTSGTVISALGYTPADGVSVTALSSSLTTTNTNVSSVSSTLFSVSSTVTSLQSSVAASFAAITSSQWTTSGSAIYYNTGSVGLGTTTPASKLHIVGNITAESNDGSAVPAQMIVRGATNNNQQLLIGYNTTSDYSSIQSIKQGASMMPLVLNGAGGNVGIGTTAPVTKLDVSGGVRIGSETSTCAAALAGTLRYSGNNVEYCDGTSWQAFGVSGAGLQSFNGSTSGTQSLSTGTGGIAPNFTTSNGVHTLNIPLAGTGSVTAGLISNTDYTTFTNKITSSAASIAQVLGYVPANDAASGTYAQKANNLSDLTNVATARTNLGLGTFATASSIDLGSASATGTLAIARLPAFSGDATIAAASNTIILSNSGVTAGTYTKVTVDSKGRVTSSSALASTDVTTALGYTPASASAATQWTTSGTNIYYNTGNVGIGTSTPSSPLEILSNSATYVDVKGVGDTYTFSALSLWDSGTNKRWAVGHRKYVGETNNFYVEEYDGTSYNQRLVIKPGGSVGIGTTNPSYGLLDVNGGARFTVGTTNFLVDGTAASMFRANSSGAGGANIDLLHYNNGSGILANSVTGSVNFKGSNSSGVFTTVAQLSSRMPTVSAGSETGTLVLSTMDNGLMSDRINITGGNVGISTAAPTAKLHLAAGTSSTASFKFTSGTLLTSPQSGTMEYDGTNFYLTDSTNTRRAIAANTNPGTYDNVSNINSSNNITLTPTGSVVVSSTTASTNSSTGALIVNGGAGIAGNLNVAGTISGSAKVLATGFRANQGVPDNNDSSTNGYAFGADGDTGMFSPGNGAANGVLAFYGNNAELVRITASGAVGIGTSTPGYLLDVSGVTRVSSTSSGGVRIGNGQIRIDTNGDAGSALNVLATQLVAGGTNSAAYSYSGGSLIAAKSNSDGQLLFDVGRISSSNGTFRIQNSNSNEINMNLSNSSGTSVLYASTNSGNVGIGTMNPLTNLDITVPFDLSQTNTYPNGQNTSGFILRGNETNPFSLYMGLIGAASATNRVALIQTTNQGISNDGILALQRNGGNVGIGTATPGAKLDVNGNAQLEGNILLNAAGPTLTFNSGGSWLYGGANTLYMGTGNTPGSANAQMTILNSGNVGIGTTSPFSKMHILRSAASASSYVAANSTALIEDDDYALLDLATKNNGLAGVRFNASTDTTGAIFYYGATNPAGERLALLASGTEKVSILPNGNVGIGTSSPTATLEVNGTIKGNIPNATSYTETVTSGAIARSTWVSSSVSVTAPMAGTYNITAMARMWCIGANDQWWKARIWNQTTSTSYVVAINGTSAASTGLCKADGTIPLNRIVSGVNAGDVLVLQFYINGTDTTTVYYGGDGNGGSSLNIQRVGN